MLLIRIMVARGTRLLHVRVGVRILGCVPLIHYVSS